MEGNISEEEQWAKGKGDRKKSSYTAKEFQNITEHT
jgi:hypothetical protein